MTLQDKNIIDEYIQRMNKFINDDNFKLMANWFPCQHNGYIISLKTQVSDWSHQRSEYETAYTWIDGYVRAIRVVQDATGLK